MNHLYRLFTAALISLSASGLLSFAHAQSAEWDTPHAHVQTLADENLKGLVSLVGSKDGKFIYGAALGSKKIVTLSRDPETGQVEYLDSIGDFLGAVCLDISQDQKWVVLISCQSKLVTLYARDAETGKLSEVSRQQQGVDDVKGLEFPIAVTISPDSRFVYVTNAGGAGSMTAFSIEEDKLKFLQQHEGVDNCVKGARLLDVDPSGEYLFVACTQANCLTVFDRDVKEGHLRILHYMPDDEEGRNLLAGVHGVICSKDGRHLYTCGGRWGGDHGISVFEIRHGKTLELVQELKGEEELKEFKGGNFIDISPDGKYVFATCYESGNVLCLERDAKSGRLKYLHDLQVGGESNLDKAADVFVSSDNRFVYVASEGKENQLYVFERILGEEETPEEEADKEAAGKEADKE